MTELDLLKATFTKFNAVTNMGITKDNKPTYNPMIANNKIGCAIACHLPQNIAKQLNDISLDLDYYTISKLYDYAMSGRIYSQWLLENVFSVFDGVSIEALRRLQRTHDRFTNEHILFLSELQMMINRGYILDVSL